MTEYEIKKPWFTGGTYTVHTTDKDEARREASKGREVKERHGGYWFKSDP